MSLARLQFGASQGNLRFAYLISIQLSLCGYLGPPSNSYSKQERICYNCLRASWQLGRLQGSTSNIESIISSIPWPCTRLNYGLGKLGNFIPNLTNCSYREYDESVCGVGVPLFWKIIRSQSISFDPQKGGSRSPLSISDKITPTLHISTDQVQFKLSSRTSGALYHSDCICLVIVRGGQHIYLLKPKSASTASLPLRPSLTRMLAGFRSLCMQAFLCKI